MGELIEVAKGEIVLIEAKKVTQLVQVGGADLVGKDIRVALGKVPKILEVENDAGRGIGGCGIGFKPAGALKKAEKVGFKALVEDRLIGRILIEGDDRLRGGTQFGRKAGADPVDAGHGQSMEIVLQRRKPYVEEQEKSPHGISRPGGLKFALKFPRGGGILGECAGRFSFCGASPFASEPKSRESGA